ncbi:transcriptional regulator SlyA [Kushneria phosphatilytica]|uniref:Transcriptional regulator SlyA n=1 Tax=Kushneria phosphatilytica TaxID=657387 RepID=A0A1S1P1G4_9GAMM|nr:transcriptional regulator SlyA [Kushneria phosphatilytica]OHV12325.1 transcriptional regulator [Kushneria phosphatilytica]QEL11531.1 transcriptional regulator SlyA [Kushneria phosphatilytica]
MHESLCLKLSRVPRVWRAIIDQRLAPLGMTQTRWVTLYHLRRHGDGQAQCDLARTIGVEAPSLVRTLDQLSQQGLIERRSCDEDRRTKLVYLTEQATPLLERIEVVVNEARTAMLRDITDEEQTQLEALLDRIEQNGQQLLSRPCDT